MPNLSPIIQPSSAQPSSSSDQVIHPLLNQETEIDHPMDQIVSDTRSGVQTRSILDHFVSTIYLCPRLSLQRLMKHEGRDPHRVNSMHEELNNFT